MKKLLIFVVLFFVSHGYATDELEQCLISCYGVDEGHLESVLDKFKPYSDSEEFQTAAKEFIAKSNALNIPFDQAPPQYTLLPDDAVLAACAWHKILFESPYVRILWTCSEKGDQEPFHIHQWKSLLFILQGAEYDIENKDGTHEIGFWPIGVYDLPPDTQSSGYVNLGPDGFDSLRFEIKSP